MFPPLALPPFLKKSLKFYEIRAVISRTLYTGRKRRRKLNRWCPATCATTPRRCFTWAKSRGLSIWWVFRLHDSEIISDLAGCHRREESARLLRQDACKARRTIQTRSAARAGVARNIEVVVVFLVIRSIVICSQMCSRDLPFIKHEGFLRS